MVPLAILALLFTLTGGLFGHGPTIAAAQEEDAAHAAALELVRSVIDDGISVIDTANSDRAKAITDFAAIFNDRFATDTIGQLLLGEHWQTSSDEERDQFMAAFSGNLAGRLISLFPGGSFTYFGVEDAPRTGRARVNRSRSVAVVRTVFIASSSSTAIVWRVEGVENDLKIVDIAVSENSMFERRQQQYRTFLAENDGSLPALIAFLAD